MSGWMREWIEWQPQGWEWAGKPKDGLATAESLKTVMTSS